MKVSAVAAKTRLKPALAEIDRALNVLDCMLTTPVLIRPRLRSLGLILTSTCNLKCSYCYQRRTESRRPSWPVLETALDLALRSTAPSLSVSLFGGEPLLELETLDRIAAYVKNHNDHGIPVRFRVSTNGTLLDANAARVLAAHSVRCVISFDGVRQAQEARAPGTFARIDGNLRRVRLIEPKFFEQRLSVRITLTSGNLRFLSQSIEHILERGVQFVSVVPIITHDPGWRLEMLDELHAQLERVERLCASTARSDGRIPVSVLRPRLPRVWHGASRPMCSVVRGDRFVLDVDGRAYGCSTCAGSIRMPSTGQLRTEMSRLYLGPVTAPDFGTRLARLARSARASPMLMGKERKHSSYGRCASCVALDECLLCPLSIGNVPGNADPDRVADNQCAFNLATVAIRRAGTSRDRTNSIDLVAPRVPGAGDPCSQKVGTTERNIGG